MTIVLTNLTILKDNPGDLWYLRHWLQFWQLRTWIHDNLCDLRINCDSGQHSQFLQCFQYHYSKFLQMPIKVWKQVFSGVNTCHLSTVGTQMSWEKIFRVPKGFKGHIVQTLAPLVPQFQWRAQIEDIKRLTEAHWDPKMSGEGGCGGAGTRDSVRRRASPKECQECR